MATDALRLTTYFGERRRAGGRLLSNALIDVYEHHAVRASALFVGIEGFGPEHRLRTERLLTLSEDLPVVAVAVDVRERIEGLLGEVRELNRSGLTTVEPVALVTDQDAPAALEGDAVKLTVHLGRRERAGDRPAHVAVVDLLHRHGVAGATVMLGVDGTADGVRRRGRFFARNAQVPVMVLSVGERERIERALPELSAMLSHPVLTLEPTRVLKRDGAGLRPLATTTTPGQRGVERLTVYAGEQARRAGRPLHGALVRALRAEGAAGATAMRGLWGYHGDHLPHGERLWSVRRHVPVVTVLLDTPENTRRWFEVVDRLTAETGLVTAETVPEAWDPRAPEGL
jgi:PII-like signaling protein